MMWQNLVRGKCPDCNGRLQAIREQRVGIVYECTNRACHFAIGKRKMVEILTDKTHMLRKYITPEEKEKLDAMAEEEMIART